MLVTPLLMADAVSCLRRVESVLPYIPRLDPWTKFHLGQVAGVFCTKADNVSFRSAVYGKIRKTEEQGRSEQPVCLQ